MFIWFVLRDSPTSTWQSGFVREDGTLKPGFSAFATAAKPLDARNAVFTVKAGAPVGNLRFPVRELARHMNIGDVVGISYEVFDGTRKIVSGSPATTVAHDDWVTFKPLFTPARNRTYQVRLRAGNIHGDYVNRVLTLISK
jgi:hypothetical protein